MAMRRISFSICKKISST